MSYHIHPDDLTDGGLLRLVADGLLDPGPMRPSTWPTESDLAEMRQRLHDIAELVEIQEDLHA